MQTPIQKAISEFQKVTQNKPSLSEEQIMYTLLEIEKYYEKQYLRDVAEKAWDACQEWNDFIDDDGTLGEIIRNKMPPDKEDFIKKQIKDDYEY